MLGAHPDGVVLAAGDHAAGGGPQHGDGLLVSAQDRAGQLTADQVLAAVARGGGHGATPRGPCGGGGPLPPLADIGSQDYLTRMWLDKICRRWVVGADISSWSGLRTCVYTLQVRGGLLWDTTVG